MRRMSVRMLWAAVCATVLACGGGTEGATIEGRVTDGSGSQPQLRGAAMGKFGGSGTAAATTEVRAFRVGTGGQLTLVATAQVEADGSYALAAPAGGVNLIVQASNSDGEVVASGIVHMTGSVDTPVAVAPLSTETSVESEVFLAMVAAGSAAAAEVNTIDLRTRINAEVAAEVRAQAEAGTSTATTIAGLADAIAAAQAARLEALAEAGIATSQQALFSAQLEAAQRLDASLDAGAAASTSAYDAFFSEVAAAEVALGIDAEVSAQSEQQASASFRLMVDARVEIDGNAGGAAVADAAVRLAASLEARASDAAIDAILAAGQLAAGAEAAANTALAELRQRLFAATSTAQAASAYATFTLSLTGSANVSTSVVGIGLEVNATTSVSLQQAVSASTDAAATLDAALQAALSRAAESIDPQELAQLVADAHRIFRANVRAQSLALSSFGARAAPAVELMIVAHGSFRLGV